METYYTCLRVKIRNGLSASCHGFVVAKANMHLKSSCYLPPNYNTPSKQKKINKAFPACTLPKESLAQ